MDAKLLEACFLYASNRAASSVASTSSKYLTSPAVSAIDLDGAERRPAEAHDLSIFEQCPFSSGILWYEETDH